MKAFNKFSVLLLAVVFTFSFVASVSAAGHPFTDVSPNSWYNESVEYVYQKGLMSGTSSTKFSPNETMSRAMTVTVLYRMAGTPSTSAENPFADVPSGQWYTNAVLWAVENGVTSGTSSNTFSPNTNVNREQLVTFLYRYAQTLDISLDGTSLSSYKDYSMISDFAKTPFSWAVQAGIISGTDATHLSPKDSATRAQCAAILTRFDQWSKGDYNDTKPDATEPGVSPDPDEKEEGYIDPRIEIWINPAGKTIYEYGDVSVKDGRTWGAPPSIYITEDDGFDVTYSKQDGTKVEFTLTPVDGYSLMCTVLDDGTYKTSLVGDFND